MSNAFVTNTASLGQQYEYLPDLFLSSSTSIAADIPPVSEFISNGNNKMLLTYTFLICMYFAYVASFNCS